MGSAFRGVSRGYDLLKAVKAAAAQQEVDAVNADGTSGEWRYAKVEAVPALLDELMAGTDR